MAGKSKFLPWVFPLLILLVATAIIAWTWSDPEALRQYQVIGTLATVILSTLALLLWVGILSRFPRRIRFGVVGVVVALTLDAGF